MPTRWGFAFGALAVYAVVLTAHHVRGPRLNSLCERDFVQPAAAGNCLCNAAEFCLCTPSLAADTIVELHEGETDGQPSALVFIERSDGRGLAMIGGFVKVGESVEIAAAREVRARLARHAAPLPTRHGVIRSMRSRSAQVLEEAGLRLDTLEQWCAFSEPSRDPRRHTAALVHVGRARGVPVAADDAKAVRVIPLDEMLRDPPRFAFDHGAIVHAYLERFRPRRSQSRAASLRALLRGGSGPVIDGGMPLAACPVRAGAQ